ncbi:MAG: hypothetical protein IT350_00150 [Deltaproteobacteria bacterium]|nr:hypothetical protein [Deltaproteobacteria bacterium]
MRFVVFFATILFAPFAAFAGDDPATLSDIDLERYSVPATSQTALDVFAPGYVQWGGFERRFGTPTHDFRWIGAGTTGFAPATGGAVGSDLLYTGLVYRYHGLAGGVIRPVMKMNAGAGRAAIPTADGFARESVEFLAPEAGVEIVIKGYGLGMTVAYPIPLEPWERDDQKTGYPFPPGRNQGPIGWDDLWKNIYLIVE